MHLYLFNDNDSAAMYGIGSYLKELTEIFECEYIRVYVVHLHSTHPEFEIVKTNQAEHWYIPEVRNDNTFSGSTPKVEGYLRNVIFLLRLHIKDTKDLVFHFNFNTCQLLAKELKAIFNCKTVATVHYLRWTLEFLGNVNPLHELKAKLEERTKSEKSTFATYKYEGLLFSEVDSIIALSNDMKELLISEYQIDSEKITVIPNGLNDLVSFQENAGIMITVTNVGYSKFRVVWLTRNNVAYCKQARYNSSVN